MDLLELLSKELNHLAAILHVYAWGLNFMKLKKKNVIIFQKENGNTFTLLIKKSKIAQYVLLL